MLNIVCIFKSLNVRKTLSTLWRISRLRCRTKMLRKCGTMLTKMGMGGSPTKSSRWNVYSCNGPCRDSDVDNCGGRWWSTRHFPPPFQSLTSLTLECNLRCLVLPLQRRLRRTWHHLFSHQRFNIHALNFKCIKVFNNNSSLRDTLPWCLWPAWQQITAGRQPAQWRQTSLMQPVCKMRNLCF